MLESLKKVSIYHAVLRDPAVTLVLELIRNGSYAEEVRAELFRILAESAEFAKHPVVGSAWQDRLLELVLSGDNVFARKAESVGLDEIGRSLITQTRADLSALRALYDFDIDSLLDGYPPLDDFRSLGHISPDGARPDTKRRLHEQTDWSECLPLLAEFHSVNGAGEFGRYRAFRWSRTSKGAGLVGVESPDPIKLSDLVEYDWQRESVRRNTEKLLAGLPTNNMLLYGDRGTGKSSTIKSMLNEFPGSRLRIVEVAKENLMDLPEILSTLRKRPEKFILFLDDLSFEENETQYKALKAVLEGGLEARPINVVLYATSNRRNIIRERWSDRTGDDEVHPGDTMQEKLSLSDRFGLRLPFLAPDQEEYLHMVTELASRAGIEITEDIRKQAINWQHSRSGRSARQFVDFLIGEMALGR